MLNIEYTIFIIYCLYIYHNRWQLASENPIGTNQAFLLIRYQIISRYLLVTIKQPHFAKNRNIYKLKLKMNDL